MTKRLRDFFSNGANILVVLTSLATLGNGIAAWFNSQRIAGHHVWLTDTNAALHKYAHETVKNADAIRAATQP